MSGRVSPEIVAEILVRTELRTILRCMCVCKRWRGIINDPHFIKLQIDYSTKTNSNYSLYLKEQAGDLYALDLDGRIGARDSLKICDMPKFITGSFIGSCNGLFCLRDDKTEDVCIVNPFTRRRCWVSGILLANYLNSNSTASSSPSVNHIVWTGYGFGYDPVLDDYEVVRIAEIVDSHQRFDDDGDDNMGLLESEMVIFYVKTKELRVVKMPYHTRTTQKVGVLVSGALHWIMSRYDDKNGPSLIVGCDLSTSEFLEVPQPEFANNGFRLDIGLCGTWLSMIATDDVDMCIDVWMMKEYRVKESWIKLCSIPHIETWYDFVRPLSFWKKGCEVLLELDEARLVWYDIDRKTVRDVESHRLQKASFETIICLRSLAHLPACGSGGMAENQHCHDDQKETRKMTMT